MILVTWRERASIAVLALGLAAGHPVSAGAQVEHILPGEGGKESELDPPARKRVKPAERNLEVLPPEVFDPGAAPREGALPEPSVPGR